MAWVAGHDISSLYDNCLRDEQSFCDTKVEIMRVSSDVVKVPKIYLPLLSGYRQILIPGVSLSSQCLRSDIENNRLFIFVEQFNWEMVLPSIPNPPISALSTTAIYP